MGVPTLRAISMNSTTRRFPRHSGRTGRLFQGNVRLYVYPTLDRASGQVSTSTNLELVHPLIHMLEYLRDKGGIEAIEDFDASQMKVFPKEVLSGNSKTARRDGKSTCHPKPRKSSSDGHCLAIASRFRKSRSCRNSHPYTGLNSAPTV